MKKTIQLKSISGYVMFEHTKENNTIKDTVIEAIGQKVDLSYVNLSGADLSGANLVNGDLFEADLSGANLSGAILSGTNLLDAKLFGADLSGANLFIANLCWADLREANLRKANLFGTNLCGANLSGAKNVPYIPLNCPSDGAFVGWVKTGDKLVKLLIPEDARRSSATTYMCRCDKAKIVDITTLDETTSFDSVMNSNYIPNVEFIKGEMLFSDKFDEDRWKGCSDGIHFFINKQDAINY